MPGTLPLAKMDEVQEGRAPAAVDHTPGPWRIDPDQDVDIQTADGKTEIAIALCSLLSNTELNMRAAMPSKTQTLANARLIAAAPDLLEALQEAREFIDDHVDVVDGSYGEPRPNRAMSLLPEIDAAIAKATGGQP